MSIWVVWCNHAEADGSPCTEWLAHRGAFRDAQAAAEAEGWHCPELGPSACPAHAEDTR